MVEGKILVENHRVVSLGEERLHEAAWSVYEQLRTTLAERNWNHPSVDAMFPYTLPVRAD